MSASKSLSVGIMSSTIKEASGSFQILPAGHFRSTDGRPKNAESYYLGSDEAICIVNEFNKKKNQMLVDYEHQSFLAKINGQPAPAAGWINSIEWRHEVGLFATDVKWTDTAISLIKNDEYRYISPVFEYAADGSIKRLFNVALTNTPALDGMEKAVAHSLSYYEAEENISALQHDILEANATLEMLRHENTRLLNSIEDSKNKYKTEMLTREIDDFIRNGKLTPAERDHTIKLMRHDPDSVKAMLNMRVSFFNSQFSDKAHVSSSLTPEDLHVCALTGRSASEFALLKAAYRKQHPNP
jgi:phage I-like protein